jgi:hypothetical protein
MLLTQSVAGPSWLQPHKVGEAGSSSSSRTSATSAGGGGGPFIFNPYAAKRQGQTAAAAAEAALPEWVGVMSFMLFSCHLCRSVFGWS